MARISRPHHVDEWRTQLDRLEYEGWCSFPAWKLRLWFKTRRISKKQWAAIIDKAEVDLGEGARLLALYNEKKSDHAVFVKINSFNIFAASAGSEALEQIRAWVAELE
ncbi:MAG TPA: hypothetical protein PLI43_01145 [Albidovulum sp.]|uniref:hypothetical protein n=1 Tax=Albidovulum sp. TaxID=1872424 RepID=UPI002B774045|nr:hypothetical protein [Albidovulum sp.]